jgi:hypothetical protein
VLLILLGLWGGLAPFVGPYLHFGFTPDKAWAYTSGRLYYSVIPGAAALVGGLFVLGTRSRAAGIVGGLLAALGGAWFVLGQGIMTSVLKKTSVTAGTPLLKGGFYVSGLTPLRQYLETISFFSGLGVLVMFFGALAIGRFSMLAAKDIAGDEPADGYYDGFPAGTAAGQPAPGDYPTAVDQYPAVSGQYPTAAGRFPTGGQPPAQAPFPGPPSPSADTTTHQFPPPPSAG